MLDSSESSTIPDFEISLTLTRHTTNTQARAIFAVFKVQMSPKVVPACAVGAGTSARRQPSRTRLKEAKPVLAQTGM